MARDWVDRVLDVARPLWPVAAAFLVVAVYVIVNGLDQLGAK